MTAFLKFTAMAKLITSFEACMQKYLLSGRTKHQKEPAIHTIPSCGEPKPTWLSGRELNKTIRQHFTLNRSRWTGTMLLPFIGPPVVTGRHPDRVFRNPARLPTLAGSGRHGSRCHGLAIHHRRAECHLDARYAESGWRAKMETLRSPEAGAARCERYIRTWHDPSCLFSSCC